MGLFSRTKRQHKALTNQAVKPSPKKGIIQGVAIGAGLLNKGRKCSWVAEVELVESIGDMSKVKVLNFSGMDWDDVSDNWKDWWPNDEIMWKADTQGSDLVTKGYTQSVDSSNPPEVGKD